MSLGNSKAYLIFSLEWTCASPGLSYLCSSELEIWLTCAEYLTELRSQPQMTHGPEDPYNLVYPSSKGSSTFFCLRAPGMYTVHLHRDRQNIYEHEIKISKKKILMIHCLLCMTFRNLFHVSYYEIVRCKSHYRKTLALVLLLF